MRVAGCGDIEAWGLRSMGVVERGGCAVCGLRSNGVAASGDCGAWGSQHGGAAKGRMQGVGDVD